MLKKWICKIFGHNWDWGTLVEEGNAHYKFYTCERCLSSKTVEYKLVK